MHHKPQIFKNNNIKSAKFKGCLYVVNKISVHEVDKIFRSLQPRASREVYTRVCHNISVFGILRDWKEKVLKKNKYSNKNLIFSMFKVIFSYHTKSAAALEKTFQGEIHKDKHNINQVHQIQH